MELKMKEFIVVTLAIFMFSIFILNGCTQKAPLNVVFISGSNEYVSHITLKKYQQYLEDNFENLQITFLQASGEINKKDEYSELDGLEALDKADLVLIYTRRTTIKGEQIEKIKSYVNSGRPIVALRTASHGFQNWLEFDHLVLGGNYQGHYPGSPEAREVGDDGMHYPVGMPKGPVLEVKINPENADHPVLEGIKNFTSKYSLYRTSPVADDVKVLMTGTIPDHDPEPVVWTRNFKGAWVVYISIGGVQDWDNTMFVKLVTNSIFWSAGKK
jgi:type 1 glutamine amidotransferase